MRACVLACVCVCARAHTCVCVKERDRQTEAETEDQAVYSLFHVPVSPENKESLHQLNTNTATYCRQKAKSKIG